MTRADLPIGLLLAAFFLLALWLSTSMPYRAEFTPGAGFAPLWLSLLGAAMSLLLAVNAWRKRDSLADPPETGGRPGLLRVTASLLGVMLMIMLVPPLGLALALLAYLLFLSLVVERLSLPVGIGVSVGTVGFIYTVFVRLLGVPFPRGVLGI